MNAVHVPHHNPVTKVTRVRLVLMENLVPGVNLDRRVQKELKAMMGHLVVQELWVCR
jgi:hypothetical protein